LGITKAFLVTAHIFGIFEAHRTFLVETTGPTSQQSQFFPQKNPPLGPW